MSEVIGGFRGSLAIAVIFVGALIAASTGIVGATVIAMGLISLPIMLSEAMIPAYQLEQFVLLEPLVK